MNLDDPEFVRVRERYTKFGVVKVLNLGPAWGSFYRLLDNGRFGRSEGITAPKAMFYTEDEMREVEVKIKKTVYKMIGYEGDDFLWREIESFAGYNPTDAQMQELGEEYFDFDSDLDTSE